MRAARRNRPPTTVIQYDLFGEVEAVEKTAQAAALATSAAARSFLTETPWPDLLGWWLYPEAIEANLTRGEAKASYRRGLAGGPGWAWAIWRDGLRFEAGSTWQGWNHRPRWCIPWGELHGLRDAHPDVTAQLDALADGRGHPNALGWRWWTDPFALHPDGWHPSYLDGEQQADWYDGCARPGTAYADRIRAWRLVLCVVGDAALSVHDTSPHSGVSVRRGSPRPGTCGGDTARSKTASPQPNSSHQTTRR